MTIQNPNKYYLVDNDTHETLSFGGVRKEFDTLSEAQTYLMEHKEFRHLVPARKCLTRAEIKVLNDERLATMDKKDSCI